MELRDLAEQILFATTLDEKLRCPDKITDEHSGSPLVTPEAPGRPRELRFKPQISGKAEFPGMHHLERERERGRLLHFFANHELLATELMALVLLRFPNAPAAFFSALSEKDIILDSVVMANPAVHPNEWRDFYVNAVKNLKPGLTEMIVHLGHDDAELQAVTLDHPDFGSAWRQRDYDVVTSPEFKKALEENHITLVKWKDLKKLAN